MEILEERAVSGRGQANPRAVKKKMSNYTVQSRAKVVPRHRQIKVILVK
jgi:hypothetical protein